MTLLIYSLIYLIGGIIAFALTQKNLEQDGALFCGLFSWITVLFFVLGYIASKIYEKKNGTDY